MDIHIHLSTDDNLIDVLTTGIIAWGKIAEWQYRTEKLRDRRERDKAGHLAEWSTDWASAAPEAEAQQAAVRNVQPQEPPKVTPLKAQVQITKPKVEEQKETPKEEAKPEELKHLPQPDFGAPLSKAEGEHLTAVFEELAEKQKDKVSDDELPSIRAKLTAYITANEADGQAKVRAWLHTHGAGRVSHLQRADVPDFLKFLEEGTKKEAQQNA